jgi:hypothetical protein
MFKFLATIISGAVVGAIGIYLTLVWQQEQVVYSVTPPAKFGEIIYQNLSISNEGWDPATNIDIYINNQNISFTELQSQSPLTQPAEPKNSTAQLDRVRRNETITISIAYKGTPLTQENVKITSDRSVASYKSVEPNTKMPLWAVVTLWVTGLYMFLTLYAIVSIAIPAYKGYVKIELGRTDATY